MVESAPLGEKYVTTWTEGVDPDGPPIRSIEPDVWEALLIALSGVLDVREVFPRVSEIAATVLPHDRLTMSFHDRDGTIVMEAASNSDGPTSDRIRLKHPAEKPDGSFVIVGDFTNEPPHT